jgi:hypothetical protein
MEIMDLDEAAFIQYKPEVLTFPGPAQFDVIFVPRDRAWFAESLPKFRLFHEDMLKIQAAARADPALFTPKPPVKRKPSAKTLAARNAAQCLIVDDLYEDDA